MANITTISLFVGDINIPNIATGQPDANAFALFINKYEPQLLSEVLGYTLAKDLLTAFNDDETSGIYFDLWNGAEFTDKHGRANKWPGFLTIGWSLIANYIFCKWMEETASYNTGNGEKVTNASNATNALVTTRISNAWNNMVKLLLIMDDYLVQNASDYPDYEGRTAWGAEYGNRKYYEKGNCLGI